MFVWFYDDDRQSELSVGTGDLRVVSVDVPDLEHGGDVQPAQGTMTITAASGNLASGYMDGTNEIEVQSWLTQGPTGEVVRVEALSFRDIPAELVAH